MPTRGAVSERAFPLGSYLGYLRSRRFSPSWLRQARQVLLRFWRHLRGAGLCDLRAVSEAHVVSFVRTLDALGSETRRHYLGHVRLFFAFLVRRGRLLHDPAGQVVLPSVTGLPRQVPSESNVGRLLRHAGRWSATSERDRAILEVLYGSGLRRGECSRLDLTDLDLLEGTILVRDGKGRKDRLVPLTARAVSALAAYLRGNRPQLVQDPHEGALLLSQRGARLHSSAIARVVSQAARRAGLALSAHGLRHACATHLLKRGADVRLIQKLLGHKKLVTTSLYTQVTIMDLREVLAKTHPRERLPRKR